MKMRKIGGIELADEIKKGMTKRLMTELDRIRTANKMRSKRIITKEDAIMIADSVKSGMSIQVLNDLKHLKASKTRLLKVA